MNFPVTNDTLQTLLGAVCVFASDATYHVFGKEAARPAAVARLRDLGCDVGR